MRNTEKHEGEARKQRVLRLFPKINKAINPNLYLSTIKNLKPRRTISQLIWNQALLCEPYHTFSLSDLFLFFLSIVQCG